MTTEFIFSLTDSRASLSTVGGKAASLARLAAAGLPVPDGFYITTAAYDRFISENSLLPGILSALEGADHAKPDTLLQASQTIGKLFAEAHIPPEIAGAVKQAYDALPGRTPVVAVRSSATAEDLPNLSFAGQQETYLNIQGAEGLLETVKRCWASLWTDRAIGYRIRNGIDQEGVSLSVVVQLLVPAESAGILFTANPINGQRDEAVISAAWGLGEAVVGGYVTPDTVIVDKKTGVVLSRDTADKQVMTVRVNGGTEEQPVPESLRLAPVLSDEVAAELVKISVQIEELYAQPMDIEWAQADGQLSILQARPITALPEPEILPPTDWPMPDPKGRYMRASIVELMPDPLSPLFATMGLSSINHGIGILIEELLRSPYDTFSELVIPINGYAYEAVGFNAQQFGVILFRMVPSFGRLMKQGIPYWKDMAHPKYTAAAERWEGKALEDLSAGELVSGAREVANAFAVHLGALMASTMGPAAGSEGLLTSFYNKSIKKEGDHPAQALLMGFDSAPILAEKALYDLALWCQARPALAECLTSMPSGETIKQMKLDTAPGEVPEADWAEWKEKFGEYLRRHGYAIYDMDFMKPLPMDRPAPILETLKLFIDGRGANPYERQQSYTERREQVLETARGRVKGLKRKLFEMLLRWAQERAPLREDGLAEIGLGYPILRAMLFELGGRIAQTGMIEEPEDIYWLEEAEVKDAAASMDCGKPLPDRKEVILERKALWRAQKKVSPPPQIPMTSKKYMGFDLDVFLHADESDQIGNTLSGVPTSPGIVTGVARVLHGFEDFPQMQPGDVLVASITTPAWTPLFALASGVVTDIGGPLSHGSIVAREYGIPAVLGTGVATKRIHSGQQITVDGNKGEVLIAPDGGE